MKKYYLFFFLIFTLLKTSDAQNSQSETGTKIIGQVNFYQIPAQSAINSFVTGEIQNLSAFFMLTANCYYVDSIRRAENLTQPDLSSNNIFLDATLVKEWNGSKLNELNTATVMAHQYAGLVIKKYKLKLTEEVVILLSDYIAGYYMSCRKRSLEGRNSSTFDVISAGQPLELFDIDNRRITFSQGGIQFNDNYKRRKVFTLRDLIAAGLEFTAEMQ